MNYKAKTVIFDCPVTHVEELCWLKCDGSAGEESCPSGKKRKNIGK